ncbi:MAG: PQQ-binding-like beta-propeller repeat protein [Limisphaerales bacterium]
MKPALLLLFSAILTASAATDWPQFRGPMGDGHSPAKNLPLNWDANKNVAWKNEIPGKGWSSPALFKNRLYLTTAEEVGSDLSLRTLCHDAATGKPLWATEVFLTPPVRHHAKNSQASPTAIVEGDRIYVHFGHYGTACLDLAGKIIWKQTELKYSPVHGNGGSPILVGNALIFSCDGGSDPFVVALDKASGKVLWKVKRETTAKKNFSFSTPTLITVNGQPQLITPGSGVVCALDPKSGAELWRCRYGEGYSVIPQPVLGHGLLFLSSGYDKPILHVIRTGGSGDITDTHIAWKLEKGAPHTPSPLLVGNELYVVSDAGIATCLDAKTGQVHWAERIAGNYSASPLYADGKIWFQNETGIGTVLKPGKTFEKLAENNLAEKTLASYAVTDGAFFIRTEKNLYRIGTK